MSGLALSRLIEVMETELHYIATILKLAIEAIAIFIVAFSVLKTIPKFLRSYQRRDSEDFYHSIRLNLGLSLALALEFLLAADIVGTATNFSWENIASLAAIAGIRTFLNYFLYLEVKELEVEKLQKKEDYL
jgi:uncharacterized membrane protein